MITPLHLHSEVIRQFNFVTPSPSQHLWLYEGVTEWASDMVLLRGGLISLEEFFDEVAQKLTIDGHFDKDVSLQQLARNALDRKSTRLNSSHVKISYAVFCLKKKKKKQHTEPP